MQSKILGNLERGLAFVISAPAGTGKTTLASMLVEEFPCVVTSVSCTTRPSRNGEAPGEHYFFLTEAQFKEKIAAGDFLEYVNLYGDYYGTCKQWVLDQLNKGNHVLMTIDTQGALLLKNHFPAIFVFLAPPSLEILRKRLELRMTETPDIIEKRMDVAKKELAASQYYDYIIINDDLEIAYQVLRSIVIAEEHRLQKN